MPIVCVPTEETGQLLGEMPEDFEIVVWDGSKPLPEKLSSIQFLVRRGGPPVPDEILSQMTSLQVIQLLAAGVDPWIGKVPTGVSLCNARGVHGGSTAELALAGMLALLRGIPQAVADQAGHVWRHPSTDCLDGKCVTVIGAGDIGRRIAAAVELFGATPTMVARHAKADVYSIEEVKVLLPTSDIVALAVPGTPDTKGLVDAEFLAAMPTGSMLVNICRGNVVDTDALLAELTAKRLFAYLDVVDPEPLPSDHPLWNVPNLLITSHVGGAAFRWEQRAFKLVREQILRWHVGEPLLNLIGDGY